jgi:phosphate-selective porin OprO/OprP
MTDVTWRAPGSRRFQRSRIAAAILAAAAALTAAAPASAQNESPSPAQPLTAGWQDGFVVQSADGDYRMVLGLTAQADGRFTLSDGSPVPDTFSVRKARPTVSGRIARNFDFKFMADFGNGTPTVLDAYFDVRFSPKLRVRTGKDKTPIGYEELLGDTFILFPERALPTSLVANRDVGVQALGDLAGGMVSYSAGVFNGVPDGASSSTDLDTNSGKDLAGRVVVSPFKSSKSHLALTGLGFQIGGSTGRQIGALPSFRTSVGQTYFAYATTVTASGRRERIAPAVFYYSGPVGAFAEYIRSAQTVAKSGAETDVANQAWDVTGSLVLTGEPTSDRGVRPKFTFDPSSGHWGALQLVARYARLTVDPLVFANALSAAGSSSEAAAFTAGANWYPSAYIKYYLALERTAFGAPPNVSKRTTEYTVTFRAQVAF